ncbi:restriction endonuclease subunit S [Franconibacter helveticus]|uniref:restriction endonuclease subunit S n=1 Tax=Franconibacter helveticus TaxID=357240 RepID=UPI000DA11E62|nr:restriction endonuclease subunit S [Franconibacter helveticus]
MSIVELVEVEGKYLPYPEYKDSGMEWLGSIPESWSCTALKRVIDAERQITYGIVQAGSHVEGGVPYIRPVDMTEESGIKVGINLLRTSSDIAASYRRSEIQGGDIVCSIGPSFGKLMIVPDCLQGANLTQGTARVAISKNHVNRYYFWCLRSSVSFQQWESSIGGATFRALNLGPLADTIVPKPTAEEQRTIAAFLDYETARIDRLIAQQQRLIELLKEKRQAVISHAVTKGLNPDAVMKDSGVEWLGEVPEHWAFVKLKWIATTTSGSTPNTGEQEKYYADGVYPWVRTTDLNNDILSDIPVKITEQALADTACSLLPPGTVLIAMYGGAGSIGKHALLSVPSTTNQAVCAILPTDSVIPEFLNLFAGFYRPYWMVGAEGTRKDPNIGQDHIKELKLPIPPLLEQKLICAQINQKLSQYSVAEDKAFKFTWLLQERRTALISAAVTGKIDLRGWTAPTEEASNG